MPQKAGIDAAGALHHIIVRGIERRKIFWDEADRDSFVNRLGKVLIETHTDCFARALIYRAKGYDFGWLVGRVATLLSVDQDIVTRPGRYPDTVEARSVLCYWAARELGISTLELSKRLGISQPTASQSVKRGEKIVKEKQLDDLCQ